MLLVSKGWDTHTGCSAQKKNSVQFGVHDVQSMPVRINLTQFHLLFLRPCVVNVWWIVSMRSGVTLFKPDLGVEQIWHQSLRAFKQTGTDNRKARQKVWATWSICVTWGLWKYRNERIFRGSNLPPWILAERILQERRLWLNYC